MGAIICDINAKGFISVYACRVCDALVASCASMLNVQVTQLNYILALTIRPRRSCEASYNKCKTVGHEIHSGRMQSC